MASRREQILATWATALDGAGKPTGLRVHRSRTLPLEQDELPAVVLYLLHEETTRVADGEWLPIVDRRLRVRVECRMTGNPPDQLLDPILSWVIQTLIGEQSWGGLTDSVHEIQSEWAAESSNTVLAACAIDVEARYRTQGNDPESA